MCSGSGPVQDLNRLESSASVTDLDLASSGPFLPYPDTDPEFLSRIW
jgi:hypothetical protein